MPLRVRLSRLLAGLDILAAELAISFTRLGAQMPHWGARQRMPASACPATDRSHGLIVMNGPMDGSLVACVLMRSLPPA
jgi:hypothetical protein